MIAFCFLAVLIFAKALVLAVRPIAWSPWMPIAYFSQDLIVATIAAFLDCLTRRRVAWAIYGVAVIWIALSVPVVVVLGSPLTGPMLRAARGPLADSIAQYLTRANVARCLACAALGAVLPIILARRVRTRSGGVRLLIATTLMFVVLAPAARRHVDTAGLERNAFSALVPLRLPTLSAAGSESGDLRASPFRMPDENRLSRFHGSARGMNVVMVILESTAARYLRTYGASEDPMPNLTALATKSLVWQNAYAVYPESIKGLYATLCSRYPSFNEAAESLDAAPCASFVQRLKSAGYNTGLFHSGRFGYLGMESVLAGKGFDLLADAGEIGGNVRSSFGVDEPATVDRLLTWIDSLESGRRFFAAYLPIAGHHPYATPEPGPFPLSDPLGQYRNALHYADAALGQLLAGLRARQLTDRTLVVVVGDHGEAFGQHPGNVGHSFFVHDENVRVPYLIFVPGASATAIRVDEVASLIDTGPTILDLAGVPVGSRGEGMSLLRPGARMAYFFTDYALGWLGARDGCWKYVLDADAGRSRLFDICRDPDETTDMSASAPARVRAYQQRIARWSATALARGVTRSGQAP